MKQIFNALSGAFDAVLNLAEEILYDNSTSGLTATNVQDAIDELEAEIAALPTPITYQGTWNAATNTPTLSNADTGKLGFLYQVTVAGTVDFGAGPISFDAGDKVVNNGSIWEKWDQTDAVMSVNSQTGVVVLDTDDISEGATNLYFTNTRARDAIVGGASTIVSSNLTIDRALVSDGSGKVAVATTTATEIGYVNGVTSSIQTQLNSKLPTANAVSTATPSTVLLRDANANSQINAIIQNFSTTATASGTTVLTAASSPSQQFTGNASQNVNLPDATTLSVGAVYYILNRSTSSITLRNTGGTNLQVMVANSQAWATLTDNSTANGVWDVSYTQNALTVPLDPAGISNYSVYPTQSVGALTVAIRDATASANPSTSSPVKMQFLNPADLITGGLKQISLTSSSSVTAPSGSTLGLPSGVTSFVYVYAIDSNAATPIEVALSAKGDFDESVLQTTVAISAGATSATTLYSTSVRTNRSIRLIGRMTVVNTAGVWSTPTLTYNGYIASKIDKFLNSGNILIGNSTNVATSVAVSGDVLVSNTGVTSYNGIVPIAKGGTGSATQNFVDLTTAQAIAGSKNFTENVNAGGFLSMTPQNDAIATGADATVTPSTRSFVRLTNASLTSIATIGATDTGRVLVLTNATGNSIAINNEGTGTASQRILTGTGANITLLNNASVYLTYDATTARWRVIGNSQPVLGAQPTVQYLTSGTTYTTPANVAFIKVRMVGGGGGGGGAGTTTPGTTGGAGGSTTFGSSLLTATGGGGGDQANLRGGAGGTATVSSPAIDAGSGTGNGAGSVIVSGSNAFSLIGSNGGPSPFGGAGRGGNAGDAGFAAVANSGSGGGGGGSAGNIASCAGGPGGGSGGYVEAIIVSPAASYTYAIGAGGTAGAAGTNGRAGGAGGSGVIVVEEYYNAVGVTDGTGQLIPSQTGNSGKVLTTNGTVPSWTEAGQIAFFSDTKANNTNGGTATSGSWQTRTVNTTGAAQSWASLSSNQITLSAGTYFIEASAPAYKVARHIAKLRNITDSADTLIGTAEYTDPGNDVQTCSLITGSFTIASSKAFEIQHQVGTTSATTGYGVGANFGVSNIYTLVKITKTS